MKLTLKLWQRWVAGSVLIVAVLGGSYVGARHYAWPAYKLRRLDGMNRDARAFLVAGDYANATLTARKSLQSTTVNPEAWRVAAESAKARAQSDTVYYQENLCRVEPTRDNYLELMRLALQFSAPHYAVDAIKALGDEAREDPEFHRLAAQAFIRTSQLLRAKFHLVALVQLQPTDLIAQLDLAELELAMDTTRGDGALRERLLGLAEQPALRRRALALLVRDRLTGKVVAGTAALVRALQAEPALTAAERLLVVEGLYLVGAPEAPELLAALQAEVAEEPVQVARVLDFLVRSGRPQDVAPWALTLPAATRADEEVQRQQAEALLALRDYAGLEAALRGAKWARADYLRAALLAHAYRQQGRVADFAGAWKLALAGLGGDLHKATALLARVDAWRWVEERHEVVWKLFAVVPENPSVQQILITWEKHRGNTPNLNRLFGRIVEVQPADEVARNNFVYTSLLLDTNLSRVGLLAADLAAAHPENPHFVTTHALALLKQGKAVEALARLDQLSPGEQAEPVRRLLRALGLAETGDATAAGELLDGVALAAMLPEEKNLALTLQSTLAKSANTRGDRSRLLAVQADRAGATAMAGWLTVVAEATQREASTDMRLADSLYARGDAAGLRTLLQDRNWQEGDYLRAALLAWTARQRGETRDSGEQWRQALAMAGGRPERLGDLRALASLWAWQPEELTALNRLFERQSSDRALLSELLAHYREARRTPELVRVLGVYLAENANARDEALRYAYYSLLLDSNLTRAHVLARQAFEATPTDGAGRAVYAFSLWKQRRTAEAVDLFSVENSAVALHQPIPEALVRALVMMASGQSEAARTSLTRFDFTNALPEEAKLAEGLTGQLAAASPANRVATNAGR